MEGGATVTVPVTTERRREAPRGQGRREPGVSKLPVSLITVHLGPPVTEPTRHLSPVLLVVQSLTHHTSNLQDEPTSVVERGDPEWVLRGSPLGGG